MQRRVDNERSAVYAAEAAAFAGTDLEAVVGVEAVASLVRRLVAGSWWPGGEVVVRAARPDAMSSSARCHGEDDPTVIRIARGQATVATAAHELAHALAGVGSGHDAIFRAAYLDVIAVITNLDSTDRRHRVHVRQLADAFAGDRLNVGERQWVAPPDSTAGPISL